MNGCACVFMFKNRAKPTIFSLQLMVLINLHKCRSSCIRETQLIIMTMSVALCNYFWFPSRSRLKYEYTYISYKEL